jgi:hypothetical protein
MGEEKQEMIRCRAILEVLGKPKEHVEKTMGLLVNRIKERPETTVVNEKFADIKPEGNTMFSTFVELELVLRGFTSLTSFCFDFMPSSIEIEKPENLTVKNRDISNIFNDLQSKLHDVDMVAKTLRVERDFLKRNLHTMIGNLITILIKINKNTPEALSKFTGINEAELKEHLDKLIKDGKIKKEGEVYQLS